MTAGMPAPDPDRHGERRSSDTERDMTATRKPRQLAAGGRNPGATEEMMAVATGAAVLAVRGGSRAGR